MTNQTIKRALLTTNILTAILLLFVLNRTDYHSKIYRRFFSQTKNQNWNYNDNVSYQCYVTTYSLYNEQKNIVMLGNSLTQYASWTELLNRPDVANRGIGGDITAGFLGRLKYIVDIKPKIVFIEGGVNDLNREIHQDTIIKNLTTIVETLQKQDIKPVLTAVTLLAEQYKSKDPIEQNKKIKELNKQIFKLAKDKNINLIDLNQFLSNEFFCNPEFVVKDGIHFTGKTYIFWKQEVEKILKQENI